MCIYVYSFIKWEKSLKSKTLGNLLNSSEETIMLYFRTFPPVTFIPPLYLHQTPPLTLIQPPLTLIHPPSNVYPTPPPSLIQYPSNPHPAHLPSSNPLWTLCIPLLPSSDSSTSHPTPSNHNPTPSNPYPIPLSSFNPLYLHQTPL